MRVFSKHGVAFEAKWPSDQEAQGSLKAAVIENSMPDAKWRQRPVRDIALEYPDVVSHTNIPMGEVLGTGLGRDNTQEFLSARVENSSVLPVTWHDFAGGSPDAIWRTTPVTLPALYDLQREIDEVAKHASEPDWDGDDALPLDPSTISVAKQLASLFPPYRNPPEVSATPQGEIDFDWWIGKRGMFTVSVCSPPKNDIVFVANLEDAEFRGRERWVNNRLPQLVSCCFKRMKGWL